MEAEAGVSLRQVKLKVLYTFDADHKNNHLARWPQTLDVRSAQIDESSVIGCIDLRTCLDAVTTASPELTSNTDNDFTIYAYDYSEPDTPLVGQGMLSKALAQEIGADADNEAMVTGKITKSVMGLFSKNAQETLEVKLRLTPVAGMGFRRRSGSVSSNPDAVQSQWNSLSQTNGAFRSASPLMDTSGLEVMQRMLSEGGPPRDRSGSIYGDSFYDQNQSTSRPTSRAGTPTQPQQFNLQRQPNQISRPASRSGTRPMGHARRDSFNSGYYSGDEIIEEGPAKKRARLQKVEHPSKSNLNIERQPDSLRVAASIASSVRIHRPTPFNPASTALQHIHLGDEPVRPPTPVPAPTKTGKPRGRPRKVVSANLLRGPKRQSSPANNSAQQTTTDPSILSPEEHRADSITSTPADLPSSPPVMPETQNLVTSPQLPPLLNETDSGFMSGGLEDLFGDDMPLLDFNDFLHDKPVELEQVQHDAQRHSSTTNTNNSVNEIDTMANLPSVFDDGNDFDRQTTEMEPPPPKSASVPVLPKANSFTSNHRPIVPAPRLAPALAPKSAQHLQLTRAQTTLPQIPASDPVGRTFQRSNTWAPDMSDAIMSDAVTNDEHAKAKPRKRVGKEQTKARLENAIASGEMPPFCDNCGAIETPAWRRAYSKVFDCAWDELETSLEPGECCYKEPMEHDDDGNIIKFKGYKTERRQDEKASDDWTQICLCNPCGLWFHKSKFPRPPEKWQKRDPNEKRKRKRGPKPKKRSNMPKPVAKNDIPPPASEDSSPADTAAEGEDGEDNTDGITLNGDEAHDDNELELPPMPREIRGGSAEPANRGLRFSSAHHSRNHGRKVQSSPALPGHTRTNAIEIDLTPKPVRRQLFPSPQSLKNKSNIAAATALTKERIELPKFVRRSPRLNKIRDVFATNIASTSLVAVGDLEKENIGPVASHNNDDDDDGLEALFDIGFDESMPPPTTPKRRSERLLFKTPGRTPSREFGEAMSPNVQRTPSMIRTPKDMQFVTSKMISEIHKNHNPAEMTPFSRSIFESLHQTDTECSGQRSISRLGGTGQLRKTPRKSVVKDIGGVFDFPDLPSLNGSSPVGVDLMRAFEFSEMTTDHIHPDFHDVFSTDMAMPSSPPQSYFSFVNGKDEECDSVWASMTAQDTTQSAYPDIDGDSTLQLDVKQGSLRRSPRKHTA